MPHRVTHVYTGIGDQGRTRLADGSELSKADPLIEAMGGLDELNCQIGLLLAQAPPEALRPPLGRAQHLLFELGTELAVPGRHALREEDVTELEQTLAQLNRNLPPLREFVLPGGPPAAAQCQLARAVCRRAERAWVRLAQVQTLNPHSLRYLNRLSDCLFVMARVLAGPQAPLWCPRPPK